MGFYVFNQSVGVFTSNPVLKFTALKNRGSGSYIES